MKLSARSAAWLLPLLLTGCPHRTQIAQNQPLAPPIEDTPPPKPEPAQPTVPSAASVPGDGRVFGAQNESARVVMRCDRVRGAVLAITQGVGIGTMPCYLAAGEPSLRRLTPEVTASAEIFLVTAPTCRR